MTMMLLGGVICDVRGKRKSISMFSICLNFDTNLVHISQRLSFCARKQGLEVGGAWEVS